MKIINSGLPNGTEENFSKLSIWNLNWKSYHNNNYSFTVGVQVCARLLFVLFCGGRKCGGRSIRVAPVWCRFWREAEREWIALKVISFDATREFLKYEAFRVDIVSNISLPSTSCPETFFQETTFFVGFDIKFFYRNFSLRASRERRGICAQVEWIN